MDRHISQNNANMDNNSNKGSTLLLVIVAMSFVAIISAVIIVITYRNLESVRTGAAGTATFYSAETAMDELKTTFNEWSDKAIRKSYVKWLQQVSATDRDEQEALFKRLFVAEMGKILKDDFLDRYFGAEPAGTIDELFKSDNVKANTTWNTAAGNPDIVTSDIFDPHTPETTDDTELTVKNISIKYKDSRGFATTITTDYVFEVAYPGLTVNNISVTNSGCVDYVIIADGQIANSGNGSNIKINGSIYGGGVYNNSTKEYDPGIKFSGGSSATTIYGNDIVSKNDVEVTDGAKLIIKGYNAAEDYTGELSYANIWAKGLDITGNGAAGMNIQGNCYITDDATLSAATDGTNGNSYLTVNGSYYGYNTNNADIDDVDDYNVARIYGTPEGSSSVVINTENTSVDFTGCDPLWLAGKSFVSVPDQYGYKNKNNVTFPEGESLSYRGLQAAYLLPGDCIMGIGHNPMSGDEYEHLLSNNAEDKQKYYIDLSRSYSNGGVRLSGYVNLNQPYRIAYVTYSAGKNDKLVYLYLNFTDTDKAAGYFQEYENKHGELVDKRMGSLANGTVRFNPAAIVSTGNCIGYENGKINIFDANRDYNDNDVENKQTELATKYSGMITALNPDYVGAAGTNYLTDSFVDMGKVGNTEKREDISEAGICDNYQLVTGKDITITEHMSGIIIATGNVTIANGTDFRGLIIARGNVTINGNYYAEPDAVGHLINNNNKVIPYFRIAGGEEYSNFDIDSMDVVKINYANWKKN